MTGIAPTSNVIGPDRLAELKAKLDRLDAQRLCMHVPDKYWRLMRTRAKNSNRPLVEALRIELERYARVLQDGF